MAIRGSHSWLLISIVTLVALSTLVMGARNLGRMWDTGNRNLAKTIDEKLAKLNVKPWSVELTSEKAVQVRNAIKAGDYQTAKRISASVLASSRIQNWRFHPFNDLIGGISDVRDPAFESRLNEWVAQDADDAIPVLIRAQYHFDMAWFKRGSGFTNQIQSANLAAFASYRQKASTDIDAAIRLNGKLPYSYALKLRILQGEGLSDAMQSAFADAISKFPDYYPLYDLMLRTHEPKWGGTVASMIAFVDQYAGHAPENSPLRLLYLGLYRDLLDAASVDCYISRHDTEQMDSCVGSIMQKVVTSGLYDQVQAALRLYDHTNKYEFSLAVGNILFDMMKTSGGEIYAGEFLELAARAMNSDTQLKEDQQKHNNYIIDKAVAQDWYLKGFYDNALAKTDEALRDIDAMTFPSEQEKNLAVAEILEYVAGIYDRLNNYPEMIAYEKATVAVGGKTDYEHLICYGYYKLKSYDDAVQACTKALTDDPQNFKARYWRGVAHRDSGRSDAALEDLTAVAASEDYFRATAAINMSMIYFNRGDDHSALDVLNRYAFLYDPNATSNSDIAVSYNNRCYAYMQLGELKKALDDCSASLKFGSLPDAIRKEAELMKRIGAKERPL